MNYWDTNVMSGLIGFAGSVLGGIFTMWGVNKTLKIQDKEKFRDEFPSKIKNLDSIIEELIRFLENEGEKYNNLYDVLYNARQETRPKIDNSTFSNLIDISIKIDGEVYKKIRILIENYLEKFDNATAVYDFETIILDDENGSRIGLSDEGRDEIDNYIQNFQHELTELIDYLQNHKNKLEKKYFKN